MVFPVEKGVPQPPPEKRGPKSARVAAKRAADAIRRREHSSIPEAARVYFAEYEAQRPTIAADKIEARAERLKNFIAYIAEDLRNGRQSWHVMRVLGKRSKHQARQPKARQRRLEMILAAMREALNISKP